MGNTAQLPNRTEHHLQKFCVAYFRYQYPQLPGLLFAIPNGGVRDKATAGKMKAEGVLAGVADLFLAVPKNGFHGLFLECKLEKGRQSEAQKEFENNVILKGYRYEVFRSETEFMEIVKNYLK